MMSGLAWIVGKMPAYQSQLLEQLDVFLGYMVPDQAVIWRSKIEQWSQEIGSLQPISIMMLFGSLLFLINRVDFALHQVFGVDKNRGKRRWLHYLWIMPALTAALLVGLILMVLLQIDLGFGLAFVLPGLNLTMGPLMFGLLASLYWLSSRNSISLKINLWVSFAVVIAFYLLKMGFAWLYVSLPNWSIVFGVFSALPLFLLWCQIAWSLLLYGALILRWLSEPTD